MKIIGLIFILMGAGMFIYSFFIPTSFTSEKTTDEKISAVANRDYAIYGLIFLIIGLLIRQGIWNISKTN